MEPNQHSNNANEANSVGQPAGGGFDASNLKFSLLVFSVMVVHRVLRLLGVWRFVNSLARINKHYSTLPTFKGLFFFEDGSH